MGQIIVLGLKGQGDGGGVLLPVPDNGPGELAFMGKAAIFRQPAREAKRYDAQITAVAIAVTPADRLFGAFFS